MNLEVRSIDRVGTIGQRLRGLKQFCVFSLKEIFSLSLPLTSLVFIVLALIGWIWSEAFPNLHSAIPCLLISFTVSVILVSVITIGKFFNFAKDLLIGSGWAITANCTRAVVVRTSEEHVGLALDCGRQTVVLKNLWENKYESSDILLNYLDFDISKLPNSKTEFVFLSGTGSMACLTALGTQVEAFGFESDATTIEPSIIFEYTGEADPSFETHYLEIYEDRIKKVVEPSEDFDLDEFMDQHKLAPLPRGKNSKKKARR